VCLLLSISVLLSLTAGRSLADDKVKGNTLASEKAATVDAAVKAEMEKQELVGVAIGIIRDGRVVYVQGYGLADSQKKTPVTPESVFNWASNSKPLAAVLAMQLVEKKQLDLDADVRKYVPEFPDKNVKITPRHLLSHQSGIPHYENGKVVAVPRKYSVQDPFADPILALDKFADSPLLFNPGEKVSYSTYAYIFLSAVVQKAGKAPFAKQVESRITKPLSLSSFDTDTTNAKKTWVIGYTKKDGKIIATDAAHYWKHGGGGFKSDVRDFARWATALINRELVSEATEKTMWEVQSTTDGKATTWGLGFTVDTSERLKVSHNGKQPETTTRMVIYPKERHGVVVMCNCEFADVSKISTAVYSALAGK
jgi:serine beta-lactamase-like protein LACTB, mitochondrial